jgi:hypothetical protein
VGAIRFPPSGSEEKLMKLEFGEGLHEIEKGGRTLIGSASEKSVKLEFDEGPHELRKGGITCIKVKIHNYSDQTISIRANGLQPNSKLFKKAYFDIQKDVPIEPRANRTIGITLLDDDLSSTGVHDITFNLEFRDINDRESTAEGTTKIKITPTRKSMIRDCIIGGLIGSAIIILSNAVKQTQGQFPDPLQTLFTIALGVALSVAAVFYYENTQSKGLGDVIVEKSTSWITIGILVSLSANGLKTIFTSS